MYPEVCPSRAHFDSSHLPFHCRINQTLGHGTPVLAFIDVLNLLNQFFLLCYLKVIIESFLLLFLALYTWHVPRLGRCLYLTIDFQQFSFLLLILKFLLLSSSHFSKLLYLPFFHWYCIRGCIRYLSINKILYINHISIYSTYINKSNIQLFSVYLMIFIF